MSTWERFKAGVASAGTVVAAAAFEYDTPKIVHIKNKTVGLINRLVQLGILVYIIGYAIIYEKGYQRKEDVVSSVTIKVQGIDYTNGRGNFENVGDRVWDTADYVIPPQTPDSVFIMTNMWVTNQTQTVCPETKLNRPCNTSQDCACSDNCTTTNGILTGECDNNTGICSAHAWCPIEHENQTITKSGPKLLNAPNFTILIKNTVQFPTLDEHFRKRNVHDSASLNLSSCRFDFDTDLFCPIFPISKIIAMLERRFTFEELATNGSILGLQIEWNCDLDTSYENCKPRYRARRLDDPYAKSSPGFNFRYANSYYINGALTRQLIKAYGIRINVLVTGEGGKFDIAILTLKLGSAIALLAIASVVSDAVVLYVLREKKFYRDKKYLYVKGKATLFKHNPMFSRMQQERLISPTNEGIESQSEYEEETGKDEIPFTAPDVYNSLPQDKT